MKHSIALVVGAAVLVVATAGAAVGTPAAPTTVPRVAALSGAAVPANAIGLAPSVGNAPGVAVSLDAGTSEQRGLVLSNHAANLRLTVQITSTDATGVAAQGVANWVAFSTETVQLEPHAATTIPMTVAIPHDTQPGPLLAHAIATVVSAIVVADGSSATGVATASVPIAIRVQGAPTAQIAIADAHRIDNGSTHALEIVMRNFGNQSVAVTGRVRVDGDHPQTLQFRAELAAGADTKVDVPWTAPPAATPTDVAVDVNYGGGDTASWSSTFGTPPTTFDSTDSNATPPASTPATTPAAAPATATPAAPASTQPWWKGPLGAALVILLLVFAGLWFAFELRGARRRRDDPAMAYPFMVPAGWVPGTNDASVALSERLVALTDVVLKLTTQHVETEREQAPVRRARSPGAMAPADRNPDPAWETRAAPVMGFRGPSPPAEPVAPVDAPGATAEIVAPPAEPTISFVPRSAPSTPGDEPRPARVDGAPSSADLLAFLRAAEERRAEQRRAEERQAEDDRRANERRAQEARHAAEEHRRAEERRAAETQRRAEDARVARERRDADDRRRADERRAAEGQRAAEEQRRAEEHRIAQEQRRAEEEQRRIAQVELREAERRRADERRAEQRLADERRLAEERHEADERRAQERRAEEMRRAEERRAEDERRAEERREAEQRAEERRLEQARLAQQQAAQRAAEERAAAERLAQALVAQRAEERAEAERMAEERVAQEQAAHEQLAQRTAERLEAERAAAERLAEERRVARETERVTAERLAAEQVAAERLAEERRAERIIERLAQDRVTAERLAQNRIAAEREAQERLADRSAERLAAEHLARDPAAAPGPDPDESRAGMVERQEEFDRERRRLHSWMDTPTAEAEPDLRASALARLRDLEHERRRLHGPDADGPGTLAWPTDEDLARFSVPPDQPDPPDEADS